MPSDTLILYIHGKGGSPDEAAHYAPLFPGCDVAGFSYRAETPWEAVEEFPPVFERLATPYRHVTVIANSIGAYFAMCALPQERIGRAYFISPILDMEKLIVTMMGWANVTEAELRARGRIETAFGETLSWEYLSYVRSHPVCWRVPTRVLYGAADNLTDCETVTAFCKHHGAALTVMEKGEHWFHTPEQMTFLDGWLRQDAQ